MSRDYRDKPGGHDNKYCGGSGDWIKFAKQHSRRSARAKAKQALREGHEPEPIYPIELQYID